MSQLSDYLSLIPRANASSPNFVAFLSIFLQGHVDNQNVLASLPGKFALDVAVGQQLDFVGVRIGQARESIPGVGLIDDDVYRLVLKAVVAANNWDGTAPGAYTIWSIVFGPGNIMVQDNQDMSIMIIWIGPTLSPTSIILLTSGQLALKPAAVRIAGYFEASVPSSPVFGWGADGPNIAGWGTGVWVKSIV